jgi:hypothetical protein
LDYTLLLCTVFASALLAIRNPGTVKNAANNMVANTRQVSNAAATNNNGAVLLQVVVNPRDVGRNLLAVGEPDTGYFPQS